MMRLFFLQVSFTLSLACCCFYAAAQKHTSAEQSRSHFSNILDTASLLQQIQQGHHLRTRYPDSALRLMQEAQQQAQTAKFTYGVLLAQYRIAPFYSFFQQGENTESLLKNVVQSASSAAEKRLIAPSYNELGSFYSVSGKFEEAIAAYQKAAKAIEQYGTLDSITEGSILNNISIIFLETNQARRALPYLRQAAALAEAQQNLPLRTSVLINTGHAFMLEKDTKQAESYYLQALEAGKSASWNVHQYISALVSLGNFYTTEEVMQPKKALAYLEEALSLKKTIREELNMNLSGIMGKAYIQLKEYNKAMKPIENALNIALKTGNTQGIAHGYKALSDIYAGLNNYAKAYEYHRLHMRYKDSASGLEVVLKVNALDAQYRAAFKDKEIAEKKLALVTKDRLLVRRKNLIVIISATSLLFILSLFMVYRNVLHKRRKSEEKLILLQKDQEIDRWKAMVSGEEKERMRIGRELHDGIGGMMAALKMRFSTLQEDHDLNHISDFGEIMNMLDETGNEVRQTAHNLMPEILLRLGLPEAIRQYVHWQRNNGGLLSTEIDLGLHGELDDLPLAFQLTVYRIIQELLKNILQHADASFVMLQIGRDDNNILNLTIEDNGAGFNAEQQSKGLGLQNIANRIKLYQGSFLLQSDIGEGTFIQIEFDLSKVNHYQS